MDLLIPRGFPMRLILCTVLVMSSTLTRGPGRVVGIGGIFIKSPDSERLQAWYQERLGLQDVPGQGVTLKWRAYEKPEREHLTIWSTFPDTSNYFDHSGAPFMINYIVDDLDAILGKLKQQGVEIDPKQEDHPYGRFAWIYDPDGNKIELWEPPESDD